MGVLDANTGGSVHGGTVMKLCDEAAALAAVKHSRHRVVTVAMDRMTFMYPINIREAELRRANRLAEREQILAHREQEPD
jgi:acyl-CoA hydrolase